MNTTLTKSVIAFNLVHNQNWLERGLIAIYNCQTDDEQALESTSVANGMGFNGSDAKFGSSLAKQLISKRTLSTNQIIAARRMMRKYASQLLKIANERQPVAC